jgi:hypothetical protein
LAIDRNTILGRRILMDDLSRVVLDVDRVLEIVPKTSLAA